MLFIEYLTSCQGQYHSVCLSVVPIPSFGSHHYYLLQSPITSVLKLLISSVISSSLITNFATDVTSLDVIVINAKQYNTE